MANSRSPVIGNWNGRLSKAAELANNERLQGRYLEAVARWEIAQWKKLSEA